MRNVGLGSLLALSCVVGVSAAKSRTERIEVRQATVLVASIEGAAAEQITIWSGPGVRITAADGTTSTPQTERDFADWQGGAVDPPDAGRVFSVSFLCKACEPARTDSWRCYGVRYVPGGDGERGYVQIPRPGDAEYEVNVRTIYRGVEGQWFRASESWEALMRAHGVTAAGAS